MCTAKPPHTVNDFPATHIASLVSSQAQNRESTGPHSQSTARDVQDSPALSRGGTWNQITFTPNNASKSFTAPSGYIFFSNLSLIFLQFLKTSCLQVKNNLTAEAYHQEADHEKDITQGWCWSTLLAFNISGQCIIPMHTHLLFRPTSFFPKDFQFFLFQTLSCVVGFLSHGISFQTQLKRNVTCCPHTSAVLRRARDQFQSGRAPRGQTDNCCFSLKLQEFQHENT